MTEDRSKFQLWCDTYGHSRLGRELGVTRKAVGSWSAGKSRPDPSRLDAITKTAAADGVKLTPADVYPQTGAAEGAA